MVRQARWPGLKAETERLPRLPKRGAAWKSFRL